MPRTISNTYTNGISLTNQADIPMAVVPVGLRNPISGTYAAGVTLSSTLGSPISITGKITPSSGNAVYGPGGASTSWTIANSGTVAAAGGYGIQLGTFGSQVGTSIITNQAGGKISGTYGIEIYNSASAPGTVTNQSGAAISGSSNGVKFFYSGTVINSGVITGATNYGVLGYTTGAIINNVGGTISGHHGIRFNGSGTITNSGTISASSGYAIEFFSSASNRVIANPGAVFVGTVDGVYGTLELASAASAGTLIATNFTRFSTIAFDPSSRWDLVGGTAPLSGTITGFTSNDTIDLTGFVATSRTFASNALVLTNATNAHATLHIQGSSFSTGNFNIASDGATGTDITLVPSLHNPISGSYSTPVTLTSTLGNPITVTGTITLASGTALYGPGTGSNSWTVNNSGTISSSDKAGQGIQLGGTALAVTTGVVTNRSSGIIHGGASGVAVNGAASVTNQGAITGGQFGVSLDNVGVVTNQSGGSISGTSNDAIYVYGAGAAGNQPGVQVYNAGQLTGYTGVEEFLGGSVTNIAGATITGQIGDGIFLDGVGSVINGGVISGAVNGVDLYDGGSVTNLANGTITGAQGVLIEYFPGAPNTFTNAGTVIATGSGAAAVEFTTGTATPGMSAYRLILDPGAVIVGNVLGGNGALELASAASSGTLTGIGSSITNFTSLQFDSGATWNLFGDAAGFTTLAAISGFAVNDIIDLRDFAAVNSAFSNGTLTLTDSGNTQAVLLFPDLSSLSDFAFTPDGAGGTDIAGAGTGQTLSWTTASAHDWNTPANWSPASVPTGFDTAIIANAGSNSVTIASGATNFAAGVTIGAADNTLEVDGSLTVVGTLAINAGSVVDKGTLTAAAITDNALLAFAGNQLLDNTPLSLAGTLETQSGGTLTLGPGETITQSGSAAVLDSTTTGGETIVNQGTINATVASGSLAIVPLNFTNQGTISADDETLTIGNHAGGAWSNTGTIALADAAVLVLDGTVTTGGLGTITGTSGVTEAGLLDNTGATLNVGSGTSLGTLTLVSGGTISGGTVVDSGSGFVFNSGTLDGVTSRGSLEFVNPNDQATILNGLTVTASDGSSPGTIDLIGAGASLDFVSTASLDSATLNIGNATSADVVQADFSGHTFAFGQHVTIDSSATGALAMLVAGAGTTLELVGMLNAIASGGTFTLADTGGTFNNDSVIDVGNGDTLDVNTAIGDTTGFIEVGTSGLVNVSAVGVGTNQTLTFRDASGVLQLAQPTTFAATIAGIETGATIDLTNFVATGSSYANNVLTLTSASSGTVALNIPGAFTADEFRLDTDSGTSTDITWTFVPRTFTWTGGSTDWNTASAWDLGSVPTSGDSALFDDATSHTITVLPGQVVGIDDVTLDGAGDTLAVTGRLSAGTITIDHGSLAVTGSLAASQIDDNAMLSFIGSHTLDTTPVFLGGTLAMQNAGTLTLGAGEVITQSNTAATIASTTAGGETVLNQGIIDAAIPGGTLTIAPLNFANQGTISVDGETLTIGYQVGGTPGQWSNAGGTIALENAASLILDGSLATADVGTITGASGVTEAGLLDNTGATLNVGTGTQLGTVTLTSGGVISGGTITDHGSGFVFNGGTLSGVDYHGSLDLLGAAEQATISNGLSVTGGAINLTGQAASLDFVATPTLDGVTLNIGNPTGADLLTTDLNGGTVTIGANAAIISNASGALATLDVGSGTTLSLHGSLSATGKGGVFTLADSGGVFSNAGTIAVGNGDTLDVNTAIAASTAGGTITDATGGVINVGSVAVAADQTFGFTDTAGLLLLAQPTSFAAPITGFIEGDTIDLTNFVATSSSFANGTLTLNDALNDTVTLNLPGTFTTGDFQIAGDGASGTDITRTPAPRTMTWTATGTVDWNTPSAWDLGVVPTSIDTAVIANAGSNVVTIGSNESFGINSLTIGGTDTLAVNGTLQANAITDNALLAYAGSQVLDATPLALGGTLAALNGGTLRLGSNEVITQSGASAKLGGSPAGSGTIVSDGTINAAVAGGSLAIVPLNFTNQGTINANNEALTIGYDDFRIGGVRGPWSNSGLIALSGTASLTLDGSLATAGIGNITGASGVTEAGLLDNSGATLDVGTGTELGTVNLIHTGVVSGGTIADPTGTGFAFTSGVFSGVTYQGPLNISTNFGRLVVENGLTVTGADGTGPGTINLTEGGGAVIDFQGGGSIDNVTFNLNGTDSFNPTTNIDVGGAGSVLTLGPNVTVSSTALNTSAIIGPNSNDQNDAVNQGTIIAAAGHDGSHISSFSVQLFNGFTNQGVIPVSNGELFSIQPGFGIFNNTGIVSVSGSGTTLLISDSGVTPPISNTGTITMGGGTTLELAGYYTIPSLGNLVNQGDTTAINGTFDGQGGTLTLGAGTLLDAVLLAGQIRNATVVANGAFTVVPGNASLQNVTYQGALDVTSDFTRLTIYQGVVVTDATGTLPGTMNITGQDDNLVFANNFPVNPSAGQTLDNVTLNIGNATSADAIQAGFNGGTFTVGPNAAIVSAATGAQASLSAGSGTVLDLDGTLDAAANGGTFTLAGVFSFAPGFSSTVLNDSTINVGNSDTFKLTTAIATDSNTGTIDLGTNGTVDVGGLFGIVASVAANQVLDFTDATGVLKLRQPTSFAAAIKGFSAGDTIDLPGIAANTAVWSAGQLTISNSGTTVATLSLPDDYSSAVFAVASDHAGGSMVTVTATCFAAGTRILTPRGEIAVERLREGDLVQTVSGRMLLIRWIGHRRVDFRRHPNRQRVLPVLIAAHAFGPGQPRRELLLSPDHAVFVEDVLIPIRYLINDSTVTQIQRQAITYYHIELPRHDVLLANGMPAESYLEAGARSAFANGGGVMQLHPDFGPPIDRYAELWEQYGYAPLVISGEALERAREALARQVAQAA